MADPSLTTICCDGMPVPLFPVRTMPVPADWTEGYESLYFDGIGYSADVADELKEFEDACAEEG